MLDLQEKNLLINAISIRLNRLQTILDLNHGENHVNHNLEYGNPEGSNLLNCSTPEETLLEFAKVEKSQLLENLHWAKSDEAGICQSCGVAIPICRLLTIPTTRSCNHCSDTR